MTRQEVYKIKKEYTDKVKYQLHYWKGWSYATLKRISMFVSRRGRGKRQSYSDLIIMADTETSKSHSNPVVKQKDGSVKYVSVDNYIVAWTISIRAFHHNIVTLYGNKPSDFIKCLNLIIKNTPAALIIYYHNLSYDWQFLRKFFIKSYGDPVEQLNTKPHYPINIKFGNGMELRDSLILAQRSLEKWAIDMDVEHKKAVGKWDYDQIRNQDETFTPDELEYIEHDTLAGVECLDKQMEILNKDLTSVPITATGVVRQDTLHIGKDNNAKDAFKRQVSEEYEIQQMLEKIYHGGFTHGNRHYYNTTLYGKTHGQDFASSYPFAILVGKLPCERFHRLQDPIASIDKILEKADRYAFMFKLTLYNVRLKDKNFPMPMLQYSKAVCINPILDNGRIMYAAYVEIYVNEIDALLINEIYTWDKHACTDIYVASKNYAPKWFRDYVYSLFVNKCELKGVDKVRYAISKSKLNSCYGMCCQKPIAPDISEDYETGEYSIEDMTEEDQIAAYDKYYNSFNKILPFHWGCWVTAIAMYNLFQLGKCCKTWFYSDTDSCYGQGWDQKKLDAYNQGCKDQLKAAGYDAVRINGREFWLGVAESDPEEDVYTEFRYQGAKRYVGRQLKDGKLHITVAGVPKKAAACLNDDIENFHPGFIFSGTVSGKKLVTYNYVEEIHLDPNGNEIGDSIDLTPCDYKLDSASHGNIDDLFKEDINIIVYDQE